jgi:Putative auto-transporter adhesin, head GIN domain
MRALGLRLFAALLAAFVLVISGCGSQTGPGTSAVNTTTGRIPVRTETRPVSNFTAVTFEGLGKLVIHQTGQEKLSVTAQENLLPFITATVSDGRLVIGFSGNLSPTDQAAASYSIQYALQVTQLTDLEMTGQGTISAAGMKSDTFTTVVSGTGHVDIAGTAQNQNVTVSDAGSFDGSSFASNFATVVVSGTGHALVHVIATLDARASEAGSIQYLGSPTVNKTVSGAGSVTPRT